MIDLTENCEAISKLQRALTESRGCAGYRWEFKTASMKREMKEKSETKSPSKLNPRCVFLLCGRCSLTCKAEETPGADSQGPGAHRLDALQERSTDRAFIPKDIPKPSQGGVLCTCPSPAQSLGSFQQSTEQASCRKGSFFSALG